MADRTHDIPSIDTDTAEIETTVNEINQAQSPALGFGLNQAEMSGLGVSMFAGYAPNSSGAPTKITAGLTHTLTDNATSYCSLEPGSPPTITYVTASPSGWPGPLASGGVALYSFIAASGAITDWADYRLAPLGVSKAAILAALGIDSWVTTSTDITITVGSKAITLSLETP